MYETLQSYWPYILFTLGLAIGIPAAIHAAMTKDDVRAAIGWVGVILLSPVLGALIYTMFGVNRIRRSTFGKTGAEVQAIASQALDPGADRIPPEPRFQAIRKLGDRLSPFRLTAGNEIELRQYPKLGERIYSQAKYADIKERVGKDGSRMLIVTTETVYTNQNDDVLCILRASSIRR